MYILFPLDLYFIQKITNISRINSLNFLNWKTNIPLAYLTADYAQIFHGNFKFLMLIFSYYTRFPIRKYILLEILKVDNLFIKIITNDLKFSYLSQKIKWKRALSKDSQTYNSPLSKDTRVYVWHSSKALIRK